MFLQLKNWKTDVDKHGLGVKTNFEGTKPEIAKILTKEELQTMTVDLTQLSLLREQAEKNPNQSSLLAAANKLVMSKSTGMWLPKLLKCIKK